MSAPIEHDWLTKPLEEVSEPPEEPLSLVPDLLPEAPASPISLVPAVEEAAPAPVLALEPVAQVELEPLSAPGAARHGRSRPRSRSRRRARPGFPPAVVAPELTPAALALAPAIAALPELPEQDADVPEAVTDVAPELAAVEQEGTAPKVPFYKKDFSLKRGSSKPKQTKEPKQKKEPKAERAKPKEEPKPKVASQPSEEPIAETGDPATGAKVPFYKRDFSFKRSAKQWDAAEPAASKPKAREAEVEDAPPAAPEAFHLQDFASRQEREEDRRSQNRRLPDRRGAYQQRQLTRAHAGRARAARPGLVVGGELRDPEALAIALRDFFKRHNLPKRGIRLGIANNRIGVRTFDVVGIDDPKQLANAIRFRAQEVLPIPIEDAVLDYQVLSESVNAEGQPVSRVLLVVAYRELVDRYVYACEKAGLQIVGIDLEAFALLRAVAEPHDPLPGSERGAVVAVSVGHDRSTFAVSDGRICEFTRVLEWGGWSLNVAIARALDMSPSEAERIKRALSFAGPTEAPDGFSEDQLTAAHEAARRQLQTFARELVSSLQFYQNQPGCWASARSSSPAAQRICPGSAPSSSA